MRLVVGSLANRNEHHGYQVRHLDHTWSDTATEGKKSVSSECLTHDHSTLVVAAVWQKIQSGTCSSPASVKVIKIAP